MNHYKSIALLVLLWGIASGLGLKYSIPMMKSINDTDLMVLSATIPVMFFPGTLVFAWKRPIWWVVVVQLLISLVAAVISGYFIDTVLRNLLLGVLSSLILFVASRLAKNLKAQLILSFGLAFLFFTAANIYGHQLNASGLGVLAKVIVSMGLSFGVCLWGMMRWMRW
ncbi:MAG: hypothetical protein ACFB10_21565 [Salibacteraceae bacterium]